MQTVFHMKRGDDLLAVLVIIGAADEMFWCRCSFSPTELFAEVEPLYRRQSEPIEEDELSRIDEQLLAMGLVLIDIEKAIEIKYFSFFFETDDTVVLRYAEPPYLEG